MSIGSGNEDDDVDLFLGKNGSSDGDKVKANEVTENLDAKIVFVGDGAVGKTCTIITKSEGRFPSEYIYHGRDNFVVDVVTRNTNVRMTLWDTAGQEDYDELRPLSYPNTDVFIVCFSLVNHASFRNVTEKWIPEIVYCAPNTPYILVGTKLDLRDDPRILRELKEDGVEGPITTEQGQKLMAEIGAQVYVEYSSLTFKFLNEVFEEAANVCVSSSRKNKGSNHGSISGILSGLKGFVFGSDESSGFKQNPKIASKYRKVHEAKVRVQEEQRERERRKKIERYRIIIDAELEEAKKMRPLFEKLSHDIVQFILNRWVILDIPKDCYHFRHGMANFRNDLRLTLDNFVIRQYFACFVTRSSSSQYSKKRKIIQLFFNFAVSHSKLNYLPAKLQCVILKSRIHSTVVRDQRNELVYSELHFHPNIYDPKSTGKVLKIRNFCFPGELRWWKHSKNVYPVTVTQFNGMNNQILNLEETVIVIEHLRFVSYHSAQVGQTLFTEVNKFKNLESLQITSFGSPNKNILMNRRSGTKNIIVDETFRLINLKKFSLRSPYIFSDKFAFDDSEFPNLEILEIVFRPKKNSNARVKKKKSATDGLWCDKKISKVQFDNICDRLTHLRVLRFECMDLGEIEDRFHFLFSERFEVIHFINCKFRFEVLSQVDDLFEKCDNLRDLRIVHIMEKKPSSSVVWIEENQKEFPQEFMKQFEIFKEKRKKEGRIVLIYNLSSLNENYFSE